MQVEFPKDGGRRIVPLSSPWADYHEAIGHDATSADLDTAAAWLANEQILWRSALSFDDVVAGGMLADVLTRLGGRLGRSSPVVVIDLRDAARVADLCERKEYLIKRRRLKRRGEINLLHHHEPNQVADALARLVALHQRQWQGRPDAVAPFTEDGIIRTFQDLARRGSRAGFLTISELRCADDTIASYLGFVMDRRYFAYRTAFDQSLRALSPGHILLQEMIRDFAARGMQYFDFMRGAYPYKAQYGNLLTNNLVWIPPA